ncbi:MAG TPA: peptidoglycan DD-metalloendopeptidase family protein [Kofleriaceae bacterium]|nr:peptidoglycan DD-metalloendopeptidase family protein [Kofleriaceae bacterium]
MRSLGHSDFRLGGPPARRTGGWVALVLGALVVVNLYVFVWDKKTSVGAIKREADRATPSAMLPSHPLEAGVAPATIPPSPPGSAATTGGGAAPAPIGPPGTIDGKVGKTDTLGRVLKKSGLTAVEADEVIRALSGTFDFKTMRAGQTYRIERGPDGRVRLFELVVSKVVTVRAERGPDGALTGKSTSSQTKLEDKALGGRIDSSLYAAIKARGESPALADLLVDVFAYDLDFYNDTHDGDTFRVIVEKQVRDGSEPLASGAVAAAAAPAAGELIRYHRILAAEYAGKAGTFRTFWFGDGYFNDQGESAEKTLLKTPLKFQRVSSGFDRARMHPVLHTVRAHLGIDYAAPVGTPVWAAAGGVITQRGEAGGAGNLVMIKHDGGIETAYMHLSKFADGQKVGQKVAAKTVIGYVGATGLATGPHLHFGVKQNGEFIDPTKLAPVRSRAVAPRDQAAFKAEVGKLEAQLAAIAIPKPAT